MKHKIAILYTIEVEYKDDHDFNLYKLAQDVLENNHREMTTSTIKIEPEAFGIPGVKMTITKEKVSPVFTDKIDESDNVDIIINKEEKRK